HKEVHDPKCGRRIRQQQENRKRRQVQQQWKLPFAEPWNVFKQQEREGRAEISQYESDCMWTARLRRFLQQNTESQNHKNRPGVGDLALEMSAFRTLRLHRVEESFYSKPTAPRAPERSCDRFPRC